MTDKVQKIREEVVRLQKRAEHNFAISLTENERQFWLGESNVLTLMGKYIDTMQEEPLSDDLEEASRNYGDELDNVLSVGIDDDDNSIGEYAAQAFEAGAQWQKEQIEKVLLSEVLPCFMHGGEADEVVAKLDEVLNQKK